MSQDRDERRGVLAAARWGVPGVVVALVGAATAAGWIDWSAAGAWLIRHAMGLVWVVLIVVLVGGAIWRILPRRMTDLVINSAHCGVALLPRRARQGANRAAGGARPPLSWWMVAAAVAVVAIVAWGATTGLLEVASTAKDPAAAQVEAIKTGLSIAAGTGGVFALLLAVRRQWHQEVSTAADTAHKEQVAADTKADAAARRITELYIKAADQLGSDRAPVRLAGLYALERLAQDNEDQRPTIVQVLCAYLRMPYTLPEPTPGPEATSEQREEHRNLVQEREVRLTAQRILATHLRPGSDPDHPYPTFWPNTSLDLTNATLINLDLSGCQLHIGEFMQARLVGNSAFRDAQFAEAAGFSGTHFDGDAQFSKARFTGESGFSNARFAGTAWFIGAQFANEANFKGAHFEETAWFMGTHFDGLAEFSHSRFVGNAHLDGAIFLGNGWFIDAQFARLAGFSSAQFAEGAGFGGTHFVGGAWFPGTRFARRVDFNYARFSEDVRFNGARFSGHVDIDSVWVRMDIPEASTQSREWPPGLTVQLDEHRPSGHDTGRWGHLVFAPPVPSTGARGTVPETGDDTATENTPALPDPTAEPPE